MDLPRRSKEPAVIAPNIPTSSTARAFGQLSLAVPRPKNKAVFLNRSARNSEGGRTQIFNNCVIHRIG